MASNDPTVATTGMAVSDSTNSLTPVQWTALGLAAVTGVIHLYLFTTEDWLPFLLAGAGFVGAVGLFFLAKRHRRLIYLAGVPFTIAQIVGYLAFPMGPLWLGVLDKVVQVALVVALGYLFVAAGDRTTNVDDAVEGA